MAEATTLADSRTGTTWEARAKLLRVMAHPVRLAILEALCQRPHCVKHINSLIAISQPQLSQHIAALRKADLIACHACGPVRCYYVLQPTLVGEIIRLLHREHPVRQRDHDWVIRKSRQGWGEPSEATRRRDGRTG